MFDDPSIAAQVARQVKAIAKSTKQIAASTRAMAAASSTTVTNFNSLIASTTAVANNLKNAVTATGQMAANTAAVGTNLAGGGVPPTPPGGTPPATTRTPGGVAGAAARLNAAFRVVAKTVFGIAALLATPFVAAMSALIKQGYGFNTAWEQGYKSVFNMISLLKTGSLVGAGTIADIRGQFLSQLGGNAPFSDDLISSTARLTELYHITDGSLTKINQQQLRWNRGSNDLVISSNTWLEAFARANNLPLSELTHDMAANMDVFARNTDQGVQGLAKQLVAVKKIGFQFEAMKGLTDSLASDFEGSLEMAAKIQTILPNFDISNAQLIASLTGDVGAVSKEIQAQLQGSGLQSISQLPYTVQQMIQKSLGVPIDQLENAIRGKSPDGQIKEPTGKDSPKFWENISQSVIEKIPDLLHHLSTTTGGILTYLLSRNLQRNLRRAGPALGRLRANPAGTLSQAGGFLRSGTQLAGALSLGSSAIDIAAGAFSDEKGSLSKAIKNNLGSLIGGALGAIFGGGFLGASIGSLAGRAIQSYFFSDTPKMHGGGVVPQTASGEQLTVLQSGETVFTPEQLGKLQSTKPINIIQTDSSVVSNKASKMETQLDTLITLMRSGMIVNLDGKKVSDGLMNANRYG